MESKARITKRMIDAIKPSDRDVFLWDSTLPGFGVRVKPATNKRPNGTRTFVIQYRNVFGRSRRLALGQYGKITVDDARKLAQAAFAEIADKGDPAEERKITRAKPTFEAFAETFMTEYSERRKKPRSVASDRRYIDKTLIPMLGTKRVAEISGHDVKQITQSRAATPIAANRVLALLSTMMAWAETEDGGRLRPQKSNPVTGTRKFKETKRERLLSPAELVRLSDALTEAENQKTAMPSIIDLIRLLIFTGARKGEIRDLKWGWVDLDAGLLRLPDSKTGAKDVQLNAPAREILAGITRGGDDDPVFVGPTGGSPRRALEWAWERVRDSANLEDVRIHDLRHSYGSWSAMAGTPQVLIAGLLGHKKLATTEQYMHAADDPLAGAAEQVGAKIAAMMRGETAEVIELKR